ncbi:MAG: calcium-binding protein [Thermoleophilaceae bacterium]
MARQRWNKKGRTGLVAGVAAAALLAVPGSASAAVSSSVAGGVLTVNSDANDAITITSAGGQVKVNGADPGSGAAASAGITAIDVSGGPGANDINLAGVNGTDFTALSAVTVDGGDGNDTINGSQLADELSGGNGDDRIIGDDNPAGSQDESLGEAGNDTMVWNPGDDDDVNEGGAGSDTVEVNGGGGPEDFTVKPSTTAGRVAFDRTGPNPPGPFNVDIGTSERLDLNAGGGNDTLVADSGLQALGFALDIDGGDGNDTLDGGDGADLISGGNGDDRITGDDNPAGTRDQSRGDAGNDTMVWNPGDDDDVNEGGDGSDTVEVNGGGGPEVFEVKPSAIPGRVAFDRTGPDPPGPFNIDIGTSERLDLNAAGGDDSLNAAGVVEGLAGWTIDADGGDGNDTLAGGSQAVDLLSGGPGADTLRSRDQTADSVTCGTEVDSVAADSQDIVNGDCEIVDRGQAADRLAPAVRVSKKAVVVNRKRIAAIRVTGPAGEDSTVTVKLRRKGRLLGRKSIELDAGESKLVKVKLSRKAFALLKKRDKLRVNAIVTAEDAAGNARKRTVALTLKEPKPKR